MSTSFNDVFEKLLNERQVDITIVDEPAERLRTSLSRRWNAYKRLHDSLGFLDDDMKNLSLSMVKIESGTRYLLKFRANRTAYTIIDDSIDGINKDTKDEDGKQ